MLSAAGTPLPYGIVGGESMLELGFALVTIGALWKKPSLNIPAAMSREIDRITRRIAGTFSLRLSSKGSS
jgi:hypothetical protein